MPTIKHLGEEEKLGIVTLLRSGTPYSEIAKRYGIVVGTVSYYARKANLEKHGGKRGPYKKRIQPIVFRAEQNGDALVELFSSLSQEKKVAALKAVIEGGK